MTKATDSERWDFFVSYTQADRPWAEWVAWQLEEAGNRVLIQAWDFVGGSNWIHNMQEGVTRAERTLAVLSDAYLESVYGGAEWQAAWAADPTGKQRKLLTVRITDCERPGLLGGVVGADLFGLAEATARQQLRQLVDGARKGRAKPASPPPFPPASRAVPHQTPFPGTGARVWNVPPRNPNFTGRADALDTLARTLDGESAVTVSAVHGMGGVGKTQLVNEYVHTHATKYEVVWWIAAETTETIPDQFAALAARLGLEPDPDPDAIRTAVHEQLRQARGWLLVFDNANGVADVQAWIPTFPQPAGIPGHAVVTTRRGGFKGIGSVLDLDVLEPDAAVALIRTRAPEIDTEVATGIAEFLGHLPLALEQAAAYLDTTGIPASEYLTLLQTRTEELIGRGLVADRAGTTVATLWDLSLDQIAPNSPAAVQLLDLCAYLAPEAIPLDLFTSHPALLPTPLSDAAADSLEFADVLATLVDFSLAKRTGSGLQIHRLVQAAVRAHQTSSSAHAPSQVSQETRHDQDPLRAALRLLQADAPSQIMGAPQDWPRWVILLPHVLAAVEHFRVMPDDMSLASSVSWLLDRAGTYLQVHGRAREARPLFEQALAIDEVAHDPDHPAVAISLNNFATLLRDLGEAATARPLAERALAITEATHGPNHPDVAIRLNNLATLLRDLGEAATARPLAERALAITEATHGP
ncbi:FxSxx-COOH system tetratricopeptide repeat protein, partial [Jatrophihabitans sp.]|uniref:FxSxx-COOH system tetratricopeptide repeat protein n=1 Tax=Jatrophihabitans sp. TaxID=1932789 RepID=UPI002C7D9FED|nr:FxSxx-COOH system tetratricopeptide repeat protein [Jatrophihabitans sp.]